MWLYILQGIGYGFAAAVQPGPFQTYLISETLTKGWKRSLLIAFSPLISDGPIIALCLLVLNQVPLWFQRFLYIAGGLFVLYLAYGAYKSWKYFDSNNLLAESGNQKSILKGALMIMISPGPYIYWSLVTGPILLRGWRESPLIGLGFLAGFYAVVILGLTAIILVFGKARELGPRMNRVLIGISAIALFCFGLYQLWLGIV
ncbi:MAG: LysE family transporter [Anaerolineae bacterium]|nr:LysE family transporter [Anaerolineae bacterium]MCI0609321.1 LysE family transporter [Anaerolineae bacterium]